MPETSFRDDYLKDAATRIEQIREAVNGLLFSSVEERTLLFQELMRNTHAVKSGAGFYGMEEVQARAHALEDMAAGYLKGEIDPDGDFSDLMTGAGLLSAAFYSPPGVSTESEVPGEEDETERRLVSAWRRGERFWRLFCRIDPDEPMPYARAFLLQSHLEARFTLHRSYPPLTGENPPSDAGKEFRQVLFLLSTRLNEAEIFKAVNRDRIASVDLDLLDFAGARELCSGSQETTVSDEEEDPSDRIPVPEATLDELKSLARELRTRIEGVQKGVLAPRELGVLADRMEITLEEVRSVRAFRIFAGFPPWARDLAAGEGKALHLDISGGQFYLNRSLAVPLQNVLRQLIRNTVAHGLEAPEERLAAGKPGTGLAALNLSRDRGRVTVVYQDDGRGFDPSLLEPGESLRDRLVRSGFTTAPMAGLHAGRGVGLDLVAETVEENLSGTLDMESEPGSGFTVTLSFPDRESLFPLFLFRYRDEVYGLPGRNVEDFYPLERNNLKINRNSGVCYGLYRDRYYPLYIFGSPCRQQAAFRGSSSLIVLRHWGRKVLLPADELVLKEDFPEGEVVIGEAVRPHVYRVEPRPGLPGFLYLSPALAG